jgi:hypothetical protein
MSRQVVIICFLLSVGPNLCAQRLWDLRLDAQDYANLGGDTGSSKLREIVRDNNPFQRSSAMRFLALRGGDSERSFLMDSLRIFASIEDPFFDWERYYTYQLIRGYFGDPGAISGLDTVAQFGRPGLLRIRAESWLVSAKQYGHYDLAVQALSNDFERSQAIDILAEYAKVPTYKTEVTAILTGMVRDSAYGESLMHAISGLAEIDTQLLVELLNQRFAASHASEREFLFRQLNIYDPDNEPSRTMWVVPREQDAVRRSNYLPSYVQIAEDSVYSTRYLDPAYVKFTSDWLMSEQSHLVRRQLSDFLVAFRPSRPLAEMPISAMVDTLASIKDKCASFGWVLDRDFLLALDDDLRRAHECLTRQDTLGCARLVRTFQVAVDSVYEDSLNAGTSRVTTEGWKFLHYNAQYVLDRLPQLSKPGR